MSVPSWMVPLSIDDACSLHEQVLDSLNIAEHPAGVDPLLWIAQGLVTRCWCRRLPVSGEEVWRVLTAHGVPTAGRVEFARLFDFGMALLVGANGRPPVRRMRMPPLSQGRYLTRRARALWIKHLGHD